MLKFLESYQDVRQTARRVGDILFSHNEQKMKFLKPSSCTVSSLGTSRTSTAGNPKARTMAESNPFAVLEEKDLSPFNNLLYINRDNGTPSSREGPRRLYLYRETSRTAPLLGKQSVTPSLPNPDEEEGGVTPGTVDIPDSVARALLDALQKKRTVNTLLSTIFRWNVSIQSSYGSVCSRENNRRTAR